MCYYALCHVEERATLVCMGLKSIHNHFPVSTMALSGGDQPCTHQQFKKIKIKIKTALCCFWPRKANAGVGQGVAKGPTDSRKKTITRISSFSNVLAGINVLLDLSVFSLEAVEIFTVQQTEWVTDISCIDLWNNCSYSSYSVAATLWMYIENL